MIYDVYTYVSKLIINKKYFIEISSKHHELYRLKENIKSETNGKQKVVYF